MTVRDLRSLNVYPAFKTFTVADTGCDELQLPSACNQVSIGCDGTKIFVAQTGFSDGDDISNSDNAFVPSSNFLPIRLGKGQNRASSLFIQSSSGNGRGTEPDA